MRPEPVTAESAARETGTASHINTVNASNEHIGGLTAIRESRKETHSLPLHAFCGGEELDMTMGLLVYLQAKKKRVEKLQPYTY
jgi:hypothetical protein